MDRRFAQLLVCFFLSGFAALLYQTVWTREFSFVFGTSELAVAAVLAGYMGGLALGSAIAARVAPRLSRPLLAYGVLELGIAVSALAIPLGMRGLIALYVAAFGGGETTEPGTLATIFRLGGAFALMLPPTALMGITLPLLARHAVRSDEEIGPRIGALYAINTAGAIAGTVCAAFLLLPNLGLRQTVFVGALANALVFLAAAALARGAPPPPPATARAETQPGRAGHWILPLMLLSGAVSFAYEVLWTRLLSQLLGGSIYAFATMLTSFLAGIAIGSAVGGNLARVPGRAAFWFAASQLGVAVLALAGFVAADQLPALATALGAGWTASPIANAPLAAAVLLPVALCIGATFPLAVRILAPDSAGSARATARVYAWNTLGAILGSIAAGFLLLPQLGFEGTLRVGVATSLALAGATALLARPRMRFVLAAVALLAAALPLLPVDTPWALLRSTPFSGSPNGSQVRYFAVGRSSTVLLLREYGAFRLLTNGLPESTIETPDGIPGRGREASWLGLLPVLLRPNAQKALMIGLGGGKALEGVPPTIETVDVVELEREVVAANRAIGAERPIDPLADPRVRLIVDDARGALLLSDTRYDAIISQPSHPWTAGASHLYTREFFELARDRLGEDGVFVQWIGLAFVDEALLRSLLATLSAVFPHIQTYNPTEPALLFVASNAPLDLTTGRAALAASPEHFARYGLRTLEDAAADLILDTQGVRALGDGAPLNSDDHNLLASRSARLGNRLDAAALRELIATHDPLPELANALDRVGLARALVMRRRFARARAVAATFPELEREIAMGWEAGHRGAKPLAERHFRRALTLDPDSPDAHAGAAIFRLDDLGSDAAPSEVALLRRAQSLAEEDSATLTTLESELAAIGPESPLFDAAILLRAEWRIQSDDPGRAAEALAMLDLQLARGFELPPRIARARAAQRAGRTLAAWVALGELSQRIRPAGNPRLAREVLAISASLPDHPLRRLVRGRLARPKR